MFKKSGNFDTTQSDANDVFSVKQTTKRRSYFFDVKVDRDNQRYVTLTESRKSAQGPQRSRILIDKDDIEEFMHNLSAAASKCQE